MPIGDVMPSSDNTNAQIAVRFIVVVDDAGAAVRGGATGSSWSSTREPMPFRFDGSFTAEYACVADASAGPTG